MKIERFIYGMFNDKILLLKTDGLNQVLSDRNFQRLRNLTPEDSDKYLWLPTEQLIALPHIKTVEDKNGRTFVQNETLLIRIHDYIHLSNPNQLLSPFFNGNWEKIPEKLEPINI
jgi:hypothetical protein